MQYLFRIESSAELKVARVRLLFERKKELRRKFAAERVIVVIKFIMGACCCVTETLACPYLS